MKLRKQSRSLGSSFVGALLVTLLLAACAAPAAPAAPTTAPAADPTAAPAAAAPTAAPAAPAAPTAVPAVEEEPGTLTFATANPWGTYSPFRPTYQYGYSSNSIAMLTHSRLIDLDHKNEPHGDLATSWEVSDDATIYTFKLRTDAKWHDGKPVTAKDVEATIRFILTKATNINPTRWISAVKGAQNFYDTGSFRVPSSELPGVELVDDYTIKFTLEKPKISWHLTAIPDLQILPAHILRDVKPEAIVEHHAPAWYKAEMNLGSGPFKFVRAERDKFVELVRNDGYYGGKPKLGRIFFKNFGGPDTTFIAMQKGELDVWTVTQDFYEQVQGLENVNINLVDRNYIRAFLLHYESPKLADKRVRQALAYAIDREGICATLYSGLCKPYNSYMETGSWLKPGLNQYEYNPEKAKELLAAAEADGKWDPKNELKVIWYYAGALHEDIMAAIQQNLADVGIKTQLKFTEGTAIADVAKKCDFDMLYQGWGFSFPEDYDSFFTDSERCTSPWGDPEVAALFEKTVTTVDEAARRAIHDEIQVKLNEELPMMPFLQFVGISAINKRVTGFDKDALWNQHYPWGNGYNNAVNWTAAP